MRMWEGVGFWEDGQDFIVKVIRVQTRDGQVYFLIIFGKIFWIKTGKYFQFPDGGAMREEYQ